MNPGTTNHVVRLECLDCISEHGKAGSQFRIGATMKEPKHSRGYWSDNLLVVGTLLAIWAIVGFGAGVFGIEFLNRMRVGNLGLGFWIAQQGAIFVFVLLVAAYAIWMDRLDRHHRSRGDR
jgi:putative solute:sodium symporter small subunit